MVKSWHHTLSFVYISIMTLPYQIHWSTMFFISYYTVCTMVLRQVSCASSCSLECKYHGICIWKSLSILAFIKNTMVSPSNTVSGVPWYCQSNFLNQAFFGVLLFKTSWKTTKVSPPPQKKEDRKKETLRVSNTTMNSAMPNRHHIHT